jgi:Cu+-exporting ATPase
MESCFHCGEDCLEELITFEKKSFCCAGCKTVFEILNSNDLSYYYDLQEAPGISPKLKDDKYEYLENAEIVDRLLEFDHEKTQIVSFSIPSIHCSSCIWILENLHKLHGGVKSSQVDFPKKTIRLSFTAEEISLKNLVILLSRIGYEPNISLDNFEKKESEHDRSLIYKLGVAGFAFGNIMFLSFPEYFEINEFWLDQFKYLFRWLMFSFSLPVVFYSGKDYFISTYKGLRSGILNIDVPIALGIFVLFVRSTAEIVLDLGTGFFDSLSGLVFFLLLGKFFQQKTYSFLSFERDYKSYFPIAVTRISSEDEQVEEQVQVYKIRKGDTVLIRNEELIPMDAEILEGQANIDYSFVTGEADLVNKAEGDKVYAGGRQKGSIIKLKVLKPVEQSYLTELWSNEVFQKDRSFGFQSLTNRISKNFTIAVLSIAILATTFWLFADSSKAWNVFTAVLIIACPCAIALAAPFTLGNLLRIFGKKGIYLKDASVIERMAAIDTVVFDKTGTITTTGQTTAEYEGLELSDKELQMLGGSLKASSHPLSRSLYSILQHHGIRTPDSYKEYVGAGIECDFEGNRIKIGSARFTGESDSEEISNGKTAVHISSNEQYKGCFSFRNTYRKGMSGLFQQLSRDKYIIVLSGDNEGERDRLQSLLPVESGIHFNQKPGDKLEFIRQLQHGGRKVMMVGDGLNDAGALAQSEIGIAVSEDINVFSPACDGVMDASILSNLADYFQLAKKGVSIIQASFILSLVYNITGLAFAVTGNLMPVVAAILMPLSSISIVIFTTLATQILSKKLEN